MKEYKYKINGNNYNVAIGDIVDGKAEVLEVLTDAEKVCGEVVV